MAKTKVVMSPELLEWRRKQRHGTIMKPKTFRKIESNAIKQGYTKEQAQNIAGSAYWNSAESKYKDSHSTATRADLNKRGTIRRF